MRFVHDCRPCAREGEPPSAALGTAAHRPRPRRAAALAAWRPAGQQQRLAAVAERRADASADAAPARQDDVD